MNTISKKGEDFELHEVLTADDKISPLYNNEAIKQIDSELPFPSNNANATKFKSIFTKEEGAKFNHYVDQIRKEWDRDLR